MFSVMTCIKDFCLRASIKISSLERSKVAKSSLRPNCRDIKMVLWGKHQLIARNYVMQTGKALTVLDILKPFWHKGWFCIIIRYPSGEFMILVWPVPHHGNCNLRDTCQGAIYKHITIDITKLGVNIVLFVGCPFNLTRDTFPSPTDTEPNQK